MSNNQIRDAFDRIEPEKGAQQRMYQNILKKAAAQQQEAVPDQQREITPENEQPHEKPKIIRPVWQKYMGLAACLALVLVGSFALRSTEHFGNNEQTPVLVGSPIQDVSGPEDFVSLGIEMDVPEDATDISYYILDGEIARIDFALNGHRYTYSVSRVDGDFSGVNGTVTSSISVDAEHSAVLELYDSEIWNACWKNGDLTFYLTNDDGTEEDTMISLIKDLTSQLP